MLLSNSVLDYHLLKLKKSKFRNSFTLHTKDYQYLEKHGISEIIDHAHTFILERLSSAYPVNDGKQTPFKNHPDFVAQHATATCCRKCMNKWYKIPKGIELTPEQIDFSVDIIIHWIKSQQIHYNRHEN